MDSDVLFEPPNVLGDDGGRFTILSELGRGSNGVVYRVLDKELQREVALKTVHSPDPSRSSRLVHEFRALSGLRHPNLVQLYELFVRDQAVYFTMELVEGSGLLAWFQDGPSRPEEKLRRATTQLVQGVMALHQAQRLHRDIKPMNIRVTQEGHLVLLDFGLTTILDDLILDSMAGRPVGTPLYMAPEVAFGVPITFACDWYSVGIILYELLTGELPWSGHWRQVLTAKRAGPVPRVSDRVEVDPALDELIFRLLSPEPGERPDGTQILEVITALRQGVAVPSPRRARPALGALPFVGRQREQERLRDAAMDVAVGNPEVVLVSGPSGMGKTELVHRFLARSRLERGMALLRGRCNLREVVPYKGFDQVVDGVVAWLLRLHPATLHEVLPHEPWPLLRLFPMMQKVAELLPSAPANDPGEGVEPGELRRRGLTILRALLHEMCQRAPLAIWIDDVQWADGDFVPVLSALIRGPEAPGILWVLSHRVEGGPVPQVLASLDATWGDCGLEPTRLVLGPLHRRSVEQLLRQTFDLSRHDDDRLADLVDRVEAAGGTTPFLLHELVHQISRTGLDQPLDPSDILLSRAATLPPDGRRLLDALCVIGRWTDRRLLWAVSGLDEGARVAIFELEQARFVRTTVHDGHTLLSPYHDRVQEAVVRSLGEVERRRLHREVAEAMVDRGQPGVDIIAHWLGAGDLKAAASAALTAAEAARATLAFREAARLYEQAVELGEADVGLIERLADTLVLAGRSADAARRFLQAADRVVAPSDQLRLRARGGEQLIKSGQLERGLAELGVVMKALGIELPATPMRALALILWRRLVALLRNIDPPAHKLIGVADSRADQRLDTLWRAFTGLSMVHPLMADAIGVQYLLEASRVNDPSRRACAFAMEAAWEAALPLPLTGRIQGLLNRAEALAGESGRPYDIDLVTTCRGVAAYHRARWDEAIRFLEASLDGLRQRGRDNWEMTVCQIYLTHAWALKGDLHRLREQRRWMVERARGNQDRVLMGALFTGEPALIDIFDEGPQVALDQSEAAIAPWSDREFLSPHYYHLISSSNARMALGRSEEAWERMEAAWPRVRAAFLETVNVVGAHLRFCRGRVALHHLFVSHDRAAERVVLGEERALRRLGSPLGRAWASVLRAGLASYRQPEAVAARLEEAVLHLGEADLGMYRWAASTQILRSRHEGTMSLPTSLGKVSQPGRLAALLIPLVAPT